MQLIKKLFKRIDWRHNIALFANCDKYYMPKTSEMSSDIITKPHERLVTREFIVAFEPKENSEQRLTLSQSFNGLGWPSLIALYLIYFCMSVMFPTIFALGLKDLGGTTKNGYPVPVMTVVGGAVCPVRMGRIADISHMAVGFIVPMVCFAFIAWYAFFRAKSTLSE